MPSISSLKPHRHLGLGPQPPLPLPHKNRRPKPNPLPVPLLTAPPLAPPLLLPHRNLPLHPARALAPLILGAHQWLPQGHRGLGNPTKPLPPRPRNRLHRTYTLRLTQWQEQDARNAKAHQHRRHRRSRRREIRRHPTRRRADKLRKSPRRPVRQPMHVLLLLAQLDRPAESQLRRHILGPLHHRHTLADTPPTMSDRVLARAESEQAHWAD